MLKIVQKNFKYAARYRVLKRQKEYGSFFTRIMYKVKKFRIKNIMDRRKKKKQDILDQQNELEEETQKLLRKQKLESIIDLRNFQIEELDNKYKQKPKFIQVMISLNIRNPNKAFFLEPYKEIPNSTAIRVSPKEDIAELLYKQSKELKKNAAKRRRESFKNFFKRILQPKQHRDIEDAIEEEELQKGLENISIAVESMKESFQKGIEKNVVIQKSKEIASKIKEKMRNDVYQYMVDNFPGFDQEIFEKEIESIFTEIYNAYLNHDLSTIKKSCISEAYAYFKSLIEIETQKNAVHKYKAIFSVTNPVLEQSAMIKNQPLFVFSIKFQMLSALVNAQDEEEIIEGRPDKKTIMDYLIYVIPHPEPDIETTGHPWAFIKVFERKKIRSLM